MKRRLSVILTLCLFAPLFACGAPYGGSVALSAPPDTIMPVQLGEETPPPPDITVPPRIGYWDAYKIRAEQIMSEMSLEEKVWQLFIIRPDNLTGTVNETRYGEELREALYKYPAGGLAFSESNLESREQTLEMTAALQSYSKTPMFIAVDEEGGSVARLSRSLGTTKFKPMYEYRDDGIKTAYENAGTIAADIAEFGFNLNFAPVADVWTNAENTVIGRRAYSGNERQAALLVAAAVRGFQKNGVTACLKHFPGHGDTSEDSHDGAAYSGSTLEQLERREFLPFIYGIEAGADMVMVSHVTMTMIDPENPSSLSSEMITGILRDELGFEGVVITDSLEMAALDAIPSSEAAVRAVLAGNDIILGSRDPEGDVRAVMENVPEFRLDESVMRVLCLKLKRGIIF